MNTVLYQHLTIHSTEDRNKILDQIIQSNLRMCSLVCKLRHNLQLEFGAHCATNWRLTLVYDWQIGQWVIIAQDRSNVQVKILSHTSTEKDNLKGIGFVVWTGSVVAETWHRWGRDRNQTLASTCAYNITPLWTTGFQLQRELSKPIELLRRYEFLKRLPGGRKWLSNTACATTATNATLGRPPSAVHHDLTHMDIKKSCISIS